jgi:hypothetical protein
MVRFVRDDNRKRFNVIAERNGIERVIGYVSDKNVLVLNPKMKTKYGKPCHWHEKMDAWGLSKEVYSECVVNYHINTIAFREITSNMWYSSSVKDWEENKQYKNFSQYELQVFLHDKFWNKEKAK